MKLKKKSIAAFIFAICLVMPAILLFAACGKHEHTFSSDWTKTETQHWHACTDENCDEKSDLGDHNFVWVEKTPAGVHTDKVETGTCSQCNFKIDRTVPNTATHTYETASWEKDKTGHWHKSTCDETEPAHQALKNDFAEHTYGAWTEKTPAEFHKNRVNHRVCSVCGFEDIKEVLESMEHTWKYDYDSQNHWEETTCEGHDKLTRNLEAHTTKWIILNNQEHQLVTDCEEHGMYSIKTGNHRYADETDADCEDCGFNRGPAGKGSFKVNTFEAKTYNGREQAAVTLSDCTVNEAIKSLCEIQYKVKGASDSTYTATVPTNAGTYEVRIYCRGNAIYLEGEVAKAEADYVINKYKVEIVKNSSFKVAYDKAAMDDPNVQYIHLGTVHVTEGLDEPFDVPIKAPKIKLSKNPGRYLVYVEDLLTGDDNFAIKELPLSDSTRKVTLVHYDDSVVATLTSKDETNVKWDETKKQVVITVNRVNNGTIRVGDYMICEGYAKPLKVVALKLEYNVPTDMLVNADKNCEIYFDYSSFADLATAKPILANKTFTKVDYEVLKVQTSLSGKNYTNSSSEKLLNVGECRYLELTVTIIRSTTFYIYASDLAGGYVGEDAYTIINAATGETIAKASANTFTLSEAGTYTLVIKATKTAEASASVSSKPISFYVSW